MLLVIYFILACQREFYARSVNFFVQNFIENLLTRLNIAQFLLVKTTGPLIKQSDCRIVESYIVIRNTYLYLTFGQ